MAQDRPREAQEAPRQAQESSNMAPKWLKMGPREAQESPAGSPRSPRKPKREVKRGHKAAQERTKTPTAATITRFKKTSYNTVFFNVLGPTSMPRAVQDRSIRAEDGFKRAEDALEI